MRHAHLTRPLWVATLHVGIVVALAIVACGGSDTSTSPTASPPAVVLPSATPSQSVTPLPAPTFAGTIAFEKAVDVVDYGNGPSVESGDLYVVNADGSGLRRLTDDPVRETHPSWSPDGRRIVYVVSRISDGSWVEPHLWVMNADGSGKRQLTKGRVYATQPAWSPDGRQILFTGFGFGTTAVFNVIYVMNAEGGAPKRVTHEGGETATESLPAWAPDGRILFVSVGDVWIVRPGGGGLTQLTEIGNVTDFALSPDGKSLAIDNNSSSTVEVLPVRGGGAAVTVLDPLADFVPGPYVNLAWTPDGKALAVADAGASGSRLYVVNADGSGLSAVAGIEDACGPAWRPE